MKVPPPVPNDLPSAVAPSAIAAEYAEAIEPLARQAGMAAEVSAELAQAADLFAGEEDFALWCRSPAVGSDRRVEVIERAFRGNVSDLTCDALCVIARYGRLDRLGEIVAALHDRMLAAENRVRVRVTSAVELDPPLRDKLTEALTERLGAEPVLETAVDPALLAGLVVQVGDERIDVSARGELDQLKRDLARRLSERLAGRTTLPGLDREGESL